MAHIMPESNGNRNRDRPCRYGNARPGDLLNTAEVARMLGVARKTVMRLIEKGLPGFVLPVRGGWRFRRAEVLDWLEKQRMEDD